MGQLVGQFDVWRAGYGNASVVAYIAGTTTKASLFTDEALTVAAANPQTLATMFANGHSYGKFAQPLYTGSAYYLVVNSTDQTGVMRPPLTTLDGQDASNATVVATRGSRIRNLEDHLADLLQAENFGAIGQDESAATNTATLNAAISAAAALGGAEVYLPEGSIPFTQLSLPTGVLLRGRGRGVTTLQSQTADKVITCAGDRAGLAFLTLDGINVQVGSIGLYAKAKNELRLHDVNIRRFETGMQLKAAQREDFRELYLDTCTNGADLRGDYDAGAGGGGGELRHGSWIGGRVSACTTVGVYLHYIDKKVYHNLIADVGFENNTGTALKVEGGRFTNMPNCWFSGNTISIDVRDGTDTTKADENTIQGLTIGPGGMISGGQVNFSGKCQDVIFDRVEFNSSAAISLNLATNPILARDCVEDSTVTIAGGDGQKWVRQTTTFGGDPGSFGVTTDATATTAYKFQPEPGTVGVMEATVAAHQRNGTDYAVYKVARGFRRPGSALAYQNQTANFTLGDVITGATSGAKARVIADSDSGATGTLTLKDITKEFVSGEIISGALGGSAQANGALVHATVSLLGTTTSVITAVESDSAWAVDFNAAGYEAQVQVTGAGSKTVEWSVHVKVTVG